MQNTVNERVKIIFAQSKLSQNAFARGCGITPSTLNNILTDKNTPTPRTLQDIASTYGVNPEWIKTGEGEQYIKGIIDITKATPNGVESELVRALREQIQFLQEDLKVWRQTAHNLSSALGKPNALKLLAFGESKIYPLVLGERA